MKMRIPANTEYDKLVDVADGNDAKMHFAGMYSWVDDKGDEYQKPMLARAVRGYRSARLWGDYPATFRVVNVGFRPAFDNLSPDTLLSDSKSGDVVIIGTLYMDGKPVRVPQNPTWDGDITNYIPGAKLEIRETFGDPAYQVSGIYIGNGVVVADRVLLKKVSYDDVRKNIKRFMRPTIHMETFRQLLFGLAMDMGGGSANYDGPNLEFINRLLDLADTPIFPDARIPTEVGDIQAIRTGDSIAVNRRVNISTSLGKDTYDIDTLLSIRYLGNGQVEVKTANGSTILLE